MQIVVVSHDHRLRGEVERFIAGVYHEHYQASVTGFPEDLVVMLGDDGQCVCASGLRYAQTGFFSECYLDLPVELALSRAAGDVVARDKIFEVTGLVSRDPHAAMRFLRYVVAYGERAGFDWAFFTATGRLRALLERMGLSLFPLAIADRERVAEPKAWGSYYTSTPLVCGVSRSAASAFLAPRVARAVHA